VTFNQVGTILHAQAHRHTQTAFLRRKKRLSVLVSCGTIHVVGIELFLCFINTSHYLKSSLREQQCRIIQSIQILEILASTSMFTSAVAALQVFDLVGKGIWVISYYLGNV
jgi:NADH:ubiquinone oxidoreductase subunit 5 (subunit L)/multisubunit Na+/H+ antiporter MnhA subunit